MAISKLEIEYLSSKIIFPAPFSNADTYTIVGAGAGFNADGDSPNNRNVGNIIFPRYTQEGGTAIGVWAGDDATYNETMVYWYACGW